MASKQAAPTAATDSALAAAAPSQPVPRRGLNGLQGGIGWIEETVAILLVAALALVVNLQIVARYVFEAPFVWPEEVSRLILVWLSFLAAAALTRRGGDIAVDTFTGMMSPPVRRGFLVLRDLLMIAVFLLVAFHGFRLVQAVAGMPLVATELPTALLAWPIVVGGLLIALHTGLRLAGLVSQDPQAATGRPPATAADAS
jgi:TRAP-type C4-dicarboxylate transport system permease small subunit